MDYQNRVGHKTGGGGPASAQDLAAHNRDRLRRLALETFDLGKDPYFQKNHLGQLECRLCLTIHASDASYLSHTQGRKHQMNLARRAAKEDRNNFSMPLPKPVGMARTSSMKIGRPGYRITKMHDPETKQYGLLFELEYPDIEGKPRYRLMSAFEQRMERPPDPAFQFLLFAAQPYETIAFKVPNLEIDDTPGKLYVNWEETLKLYVLQIQFRPARTAKPLPALPHRPSVYQGVGPKFA
ncbi:splicing factor 3A subunit [Babesia ovata]|uniref:Splicing factor 3A subunit n=1 Tax=Babesia ovata TaxID=189622 RepID=A0A2H6KCR8_9APIC|nr:splicing factor 3A subunit [Babesia ovata]GBE60785.1 splicing factor 3A subunit [Babesia ovata]